MKIEQSPLLNVKDLLPRIRDKISFAEVPEKWIDIQGTFTRRKTSPEIYGATIIELPDFRTPSNLFTEIGRLGKDETLVSAPEISPVQWSYSTFPAESPKAWHLHGLRDNQWDCWAIVPYPGQILRVGLWDLRVDSPSSDVKFRQDFTDNETGMILIPPGVAHGVCAFGQQGILFYMTTKFYNKNHPDEARIPWDIWDKDFWLKK